MTSTATLTLTSTVVRKKTERHDVNVMDAIPKMTDQFATRDLRMLAAYKKSRLGGNEVEVIYEYGKSSEESHLGRLYPRSGLGLQGMPFDIRNPLLDKHYWDCDMENAHYRILARLADDWGCKTESIKHYINNRDEELKKVSANRQVAKVAFLKVAYGGFIKMYDDRISDDNIEPEGDVSLIKKIEKEVSVIVTMCWSKYPQHRSQATQAARKKDWGGNPKFSLFALILQTEECKCLLVMDDYLTSVGRYMGVFIHDGGCVEKLDDEQEFPEEHLRGMEEAVLDATGYDVRVVVKPFKHNFVIPKNLPDPALHEIEGAEYAKMKEEFEKECVKIINPPCYMRLTDMTLLDLAALNHIYGNKYFWRGEDKVLFISKWRTDATIKTYDHLEFLPGKETPPGVLNIWRGFKGTPEEGDVSVIRDVLGLVCGRNAQHMEYVENWVAHLFQRPWEKPGVCLVIHSEEEGVGKDTYFNFIGRMLGNQFHNTSSPEHTLFGRFNGGFKEVLLTKIEEGNFETNKANQENLKSIITCETTSYEEKGKPTVVLSSFLRLVMTTNNPVPLVMSDTARRFMLVKASAEKMGDSAYWESTYETLNKTETQSAYLYYLLNKDISAFKPRVIPHSDYKDEVVTATRPYFAKFFQRLCEDAAPEQQEIEWTARELFQELGRHSAKFELTETKFGRDIKRFFPAVSKRKGMGANKYRIVLTEMEAFLKEKKWWVEL